MNEPTGPHTRLTRQDVFEKLKEYQTYIQLFLTVAGVVVVLAGLWIASLIQPLKQDTALIQQQVDAQEQRIDNINEKLDRIINLLLER